VISATQDWALATLPDGWREAIGMDERQQKLGEANAPTASFLAAFVSELSLALVSGGVRLGALSHMSCSGAENLHATVQSDGCPIRR
jgi:hypothetical protein